MSIAIVSHLLMFVSCALTIALGCVNNDTCQHHQSIGPFADEPCSSQYWFCPPAMPGICVHCQPGLCFNPTGTNNDPATFPCATCQSIEGCQSTPGTSFKLTYTHLYHFMKNALQAQ